MEVDVGREIVHTSLNRWHASPLHERDNAVRRAYGPGMLQRLRGLQSTALGRVDTAYQTLEASIERISPDAPARLEEICDRLKEDPPADDEEPSDDHPYLKYSTVAALQSDPDDPDTAELPLYEISNKEVLKDKAYVESIQKSFPAGSPEFAACQTLISLLDRYRMLDPKIEVNDRLRQMSGGRTYMDVAGKKMGRTALAAVLFAGTFIFGAIGLTQFLRKGELTITPFLWGFAAWIAADPSLMNKFFDKDDPIKQDFDEIRRVTSSNELRRLSGRYGIGGAPWAAVVESVFERDGDTGGKATPEDIEELSNGNPMIAKRLQLMAATTNAKTGKTDLDVFINGLREVGREEAREFVVTYVLNDSLRDPRLNPADRRILDRMPGKERTA